MNDLHYLFLATMFFILGILIIYVEIYEIKEDYKEYNKLHIYPWNIIFFIFAIMMFTLSILSIIKLIN